MILQINETPTRGDAVTIDGRRFVYDMDYGTFYWILMLHYSLSCIGYEVSYDAKWGQNNGTLTVNCKEATDELTDATSYWVSN